MKCPHCGKEIALKREDKYSEAIKLYYRSQTKSSFRKVTLKLIAEQMGLSYSELRKCKMEYDHAKRKALS